MTRVVSAVSFHDNGAVSIGYMTLPDDVRGGARLVQQHEILIVPAPEYRDDIQELREAAEGLVDFALGNWATLAPDDAQSLAQLRAEEDDDLGMGEDPQRGTDARVVPWDPTTEVGFSRDEHGRFCGMSEATQQMAPTPEGKVGYCGPSCKHCVDSPLYNLNKHGVWVCAADAVE